MRRKTFINRLSLGSGAALLLPSVGLLQSCAYQPRVRTILTETDIPLLNDLAETILPTTEQVPGAKAAKVGQYILLMYNDCMKADDQAIFIAGLNDLDARSSKTFSSSFSEAEGPEKLAFLKTIQAEAVSHHKAQEDAQVQTRHFFDLLKNLTVSGYFTSEIGMTQARNYLPIPGKFEACIPYNQGDRPWAT